MLENNVRLIVRVVLSLGLMESGLWILIDGDTSPDLEKAAIGWIGLTMGYWLG